LWEAEPGWLNTATYGLPPRPAWDELQAALEGWRQGQASWGAWNECTSRARRSFARLVNVEANDVAVGSQVSQLVGLVAASVRAGSRVIVPEREFTSNVFPWLARGDLRVEAIPMERVVASIEQGADVVSFSLVQSIDGTIAPYREIIAAAREQGALVVIDLSQACGWFPFDARLADVAVAGAYKFLMSPRGSAFAYLAPAVREQMTPFLAGWFAGDDVDNSYYGLPLRLATDARRFDLSPAWFSWVGTAPTLELVERIGIAAIHDHNIGLANRFMAGMALPATESAIVTLDIPGAEERLTRAGIRTSVRGGRVRISFHLYNTEAEVDLAIEALRG